MEFCPKDISAQWFISTNTGKMSIWDSLAETVIILRKWNYKEEMFKLTQIKWGI